MMAVNVDGTFHAVQAAIPYLKAAGGSIVTMGSVSAFIGSAEGGGYTTSKGAVLSLSYAAAGELAPQGIRVNNVAPGWVDGGFTTRHWKLAMTLRLSGNELAHSTPWDGWPNQLMSPTLWCGFSLI